MSGTALSLPSRIWTARTFASVVAPVTALIVDDNAELAIAIQAALELEGFDARTADCVHAVPFAQQRPPSVVLLDIEMPIINGFQVAREMRKLADCACVPIIAHTSLAEGEVLTQGIPAGIDAYCRKGNSLDALIALLQLVAPARRGSGK
ncbi:MULTISPECIES: response regulator [unclassified Caballeronia]|uniref:response regulator n=1 Tax=unclassified Caballeronia TaxID=2646786 RepID=UPI00385732CD